MPTIEDLLHLKRLQKFATSKYASEFELYRYNVMLSEAFYSSLHYFEVALRNKIDFVFTQAFGENWIFDEEKLSQKSKADIVNAKAKLQRAKKPQDKDYVISELNLSFWTSFFMREYEELLWKENPNLFYQIFTKSNHYYMATARKNLNTIRTYRNRIFHHDSIIHVALESKPRDVHNMIYTTLKQLDAMPILEELKKIDNFTDIYSLGRECGYIPDEYEKSIRKFKK